MPTQQVPVWSPDLCRGAKGGVELTCPVQTLGACPGLFHGLRLWEEGGWLGLRDTGLPSRLYCPSSPFCSGLWAVPGHVDLR